MKSITITLQETEISLTTADEKGNIEEEIFLPKDQHSARNAAHYAEVKLFAALYEETRRA